MGSKQSVVVLDDCEIDQFFARRTIDMTDWFDEVHQFLDPREALGFFAARQCHGETDGVDLLLLDFRMPHLSGLEFLQQIQACNLAHLVRRVAVMLTVPLLPQYERGFRGARADVGFIDKPVQQEALGKMIGLA